MADETQQENKDTPESGANSGARGGRVIPPPPPPPPGSSDGMPRSTMMMGGLVAAVLILLVMWVSSARSRHHARDAVLRSVEVGRPAIEWTVIEKRVDEGQVSTRIRVVERRPDGQSGAPMEGVLPGESLTLEVDEWQWQPRGHDDLVAIPVFSRIIGAGGEERLDLLDTDTPTPLYYEYIGDNADRLNRHLRRLWRGFIKGRQIEGHSVVARQQIDLELGQVWTATFSEAGELVIDTAAASGAAYDYDSSHTVSTTRGLEVSVSGVARAVENDGRFDSERVFWAVTAEIANASEHRLRLDPNRFMLVDDQDNAYTPTEGAALELAAGESHDFELGYLVPVSAGNLAFTIPGEMVSEDEELSIALENPLNLFDQAEVINDLVVVARGVQPTTRVDGYDVEVQLIVLNTSWDPVELDARQFSLGNLDEASGRSLRAAEVSVEEIDPWTPTAVTVRFDAGASLFRLDMELHLTRGRRSSRQTACFTLVPGASDLSGTAYVRHLAGARHFQRYTELLARSNRGGLYRLLGDPEARATEARSHLELATRLYPESAVIREAL